MAEKFCDHGLYTSGVVTGSISGTVLTVTAVTSGAVCVGAQVKAAGISIECFISSVGTGSGGAGTYNLNATPGTIASTTVNCNAGLPYNTATWGAAQEGDGTASGAATPATVSVDMSAWTFASGSSTFSVMGCTALTIGAGANSATNAQYSATYSTMLANIVAAINLATATTANIPSGWQATQVRNHVWARVNGNNLELMTRAGSASWNGLVALTFANVTGSSAQNWSGGAGGAWGYVFNGTTNAMWPSAIAVTTYGLWPFQNRPFAGRVEAGDNVNLRGRHEVCAYYADHTAVTMPTMGARAAPVRFVVDDGTIWGDTDPVFRVVQLNGNVNNRGLILSIDQTTSFVELIGREYASGVKSLQFVGRSTDASTYLTLSLGASFRLSNGLFDKSAGGSLGCSATSSGIANNAAQRAVLSSCTFKSKLNHNGFVRLFMANSAYNIAFHGCEFNAAGSSVASNGVITFSIWQQFTQLEMIGCKFTDFVTGSRLCGALGTTSQLLMASFDNCDFGNVTNRGPCLAALASNVATYASTCYITGCNRKGARDWFEDHPAGHAEWNSLLGFPTLNALLDDGATNWSIKAIPTTNANAIDRSLPMRLPRIAKVNSLSDGNRTLVFEFVAEGAITPTITSVSALIEYEAADGSIVVLDTFDHPDASVSSSSVTWSSESGGQVTYVNGGTIYHNKWKLEIATAEPIAEGGEIGAWLRIHAAVANSTKSYFFDPEFTIT